LKGSVKAVEARQKQGGWNSGLRLSVAATFEHTPLSYGAVYFSPDLNKQRARSYYLLLLRRYGELAAAASALLEKIKPANDQASLTVKDWAGIGRPPRQRRGFGCCGTKFMLEMAAVRKHYKQWLETRVIPDTGEGCFMIRIDVDSKAVPSREPRRAPVASCPRISLEVSGR